MLHVARALTQHGCITDCRGGDAARHPAAPCKLPGTRPESTRCLRHCTGAEEARHPAAPTATLHRARRPRPGVHRTRGHGRYVHTYVCSCACVYVCVCICVRGVVNDGTAFPVLGVVREQPLPCSPHTPAYLRESPCLFLPSPGEKI